MRGNRGNANNSLVEGSLLRGLARMAFPLLVGSILQNAQSLIDLFWVGHLGAHAVAQVAVAGTVLMVLFPMVIGISAGTVALVSRAAGAGNMKEAANATGQSLLLALVVGVVSGAIGFLLAGDLVGMLGASERVTGGSVEYLKIMLSGSFTMYFLAACAAALQGAGDTVTPMALNIMANILNMVLDPMLIYGWGSMPGMGVRGAAWATVLSQALAAAAGMALLHSGRVGLRVGMRHLTPVPAMCRRILRIGLPGSGQMLARSLVGAAIMRIVAGCGTAAVAAYGIGFRIHMIILMSAFSIGAAVAPMVGQNLGAGKPARARAAAWTAAAIEMCIMAAVAAVLLPWAAGLIRFFNSEPDVVDIGATYLRIVSPFYVFTGLGIVMGRALNGAGDTVATFIITVFCLWVIQLPLAIWFSRMWSPPTHGIWWAMVAATTVQGLLATAWFETGRWKRMRV